jgi:hypothetical protein
LPGKLIATKKALEKPAANSKCWVSPLIVVVAPFIAARDPPDRPGARNLHLGVGLAGEIDEFDVMAGGQVAVFSDKPKSLSHDTSTAFFFTTPCTNEFGTKSK